MQLKFGADSSIKTRGNSVPSGMGIRQKWRWPCDDGTGSEGAPTGLSWYGTSIGKIAVANPGTKRPAVTSTGVKENYARHEATPRHQPETSPDLIGFIETNQEGTD